MLATLLSSPPPLQYQCCYGTMRVISYDDDDDDDLWWCGVQFIVCIGTAFILTLCYLYVFCMFYLALVLRLQ